MGKHSAQATRATAKQGSRCVVAVYARTSYKAKGDRAGPVECDMLIQTQHVHVCQASRPLQCAAAEVRVKAPGDEVVARIAEVVRGCLPAEQKQRLLELITSKQSDSIYVESSCAIACTAAAAEQFYNIATQHNVTIIPLDMPDLYNHS